MKKPSLDGASIKRFFVYHCEKLILALSVILLGLFFWFGYATPTYEKTSPSKLVDQAKSARRYMDDKTAWDTISSVRQGDDEVIDRILKVPEVKHARFLIGPSSYPVKREALRRDMQLLAPVDLVANSFVGTWILDTGEKTAKDPLPHLQYPFVQPEVEEQEEEKSSAFSGSYGGYSGGDGPPEGGMEGGGMGPGGMGGLGDMAGGSKKKKKKSPKEDPADAGTYISTVAEMTNGGIRDTFPLSSSRSYAVRGVAVTGLVEHKQMWERCKAEYEYSFGYHPDRDTPRYDFVEVQRREVKDDGSVGKWNDISKMLAKQSDIFPDNFDTAPEIVSAAEYDGILTTPIPPVGIDYKSVAIHPKSELREFTVPVVEKEEVDDGTEMNFDDDDKDSRGAGSRRRQGAIGGGGAGGMGMGGPGMGGPGMGMGGYGDGMGAGMPGGGMGGFGGYGGGVSPEGGRSALDYSAYDEVSIRDIPERDFKVIRFFDIYGVKANTTYEYRVRVWIRDPNNEDPDLKGEISGSDGGMGGMGGPGGMGGMGGGMGGPGMGGPGGMGGMGGKGQDTAGMTPEEKEEWEKEQEALKWAKKTAIANNMIHPDARERLRKAREVRKDGKKTYFVSEKVEKEDGTFEWAEHQVPEDHEYLRFARPTQWSSNIKVKVDASPSFVFAGEPVEVRRIEVGRGTVADGEPSMKVASGKLMDRGKLAGVRIPFRAEVKAGDLLDFDKPAHVIHPVTRNIHRVSDVEVQTNNVVLDVSSGEALDISGKSPIEYFYPGEVLVLDADGNIQLRNDMDDRRQYMAATLEVDEKSSIGGRRRRKPKSDDGMGMGGMGGPGMGGPGMGGGGGGGGKFGGGR